MENMSKNSNYSSPEIESSEQIRKLITMIVIESITNQNSVGITMKSRKKNKSSQRCTSKNSLKSDFKSSPKLFPKITKLNMKNNSKRYNKTLRLREIICYCFEVVYE